MAEFRILVVDDEPGLLEDLKWVAEATTDGEVLAASNAQEAIGLIEKNDFDLIITDQRMEKEDSGLDVMTAAKKKDWLTQFILVTAYGKPDPSGPKAIADGAYDYVDRLAKGNYLDRLEGLIPAALLRREKELRKELERKTSD